MIELTQRAVLLDCRAQDEMVRKERLELSRVTPLEPKSSASTNSATFANKEFYCLARTSTANEQNNAYYILG